MTAIVVLGPGGAGVALRLRELLPASRIHAPSCRDCAAEVTFARAAPHLRALFGSGTPIVAVCATGIVIRALGPVLTDKHKEPPVVAVAADGSAVVPLLGGHRGANELAARIADALGGRALLTTAGDLRLGLALDSPPPGWRLRDAAAAKAVTAALLAGEEVGIRVEAGDPAWLLRSGAPLRMDLEPSVLVTDRVPQDDGRLVFHPPVLALGVGCERGCEPGELVELALATLERHGLAAAAVALVASLDLKAAEPAVHALAGRLGVPARFLDAAALEREAARLANPSVTVFREVGCHGVAEGAALAAAGPESVLLVEKTRSARATCAVARAPVSIDPLRVGRPQGSLAVVGIGPGTSAWRTPEVDALLAAADDVVGYRLYLDLLGPMLGPMLGAGRHDFALGEEEARCRHALDLAARGRRVVLVSSGDPGIYAMAALVVELLEDAPPAWQRVALRIAPGISALQAAAARAGAPLGHDFCAISLSDLLTPMEVIERRLRAAAEGDFVVALYNPVSRRRREAIGLAREILLARRPPDTPVVLARNLGRTDESVEVIGLDALAADRVDMLTLVLVGSSTTRLVPRLHGPPWVVTPRGYRP
jgi:cobalt-precorrin 5A hydrolase / precorrin-3B C17-methyltransferase